MIKSYAKMSSISLIPKYIAFEKKLVNKNFKKHFPLGRVLKLTDYPCYTLNLGFNPDDNVLIIAEKLLNEAILFTYPKWFLHSEHLPVLNLEGSSPQSMLVIHSKFQRNLFHVESEMLWYCPGKHHHRLST